MTYIKTFSGRVHAAFVIDVFSRTAAGWQVATGLCTDLAPDAPEMAIRRRRHTGAGLTHHPDRGVQYRALHYTEHLEQEAAVAPADSKGDSYDNTLAEAFNSLFKAESIRNKGNHGPASPTPRQRSPSTSTGSISDASTASSTTSPLPSTRQPTTS
ncbi:DDE-type integrase/transposase/recombinase [Streptomyces olivoreticuli]